MKYYHYFFVIFYALVYTVSVGAMERDNKQQGYNRNHWLNNVQVITAVQNPRYAKYFVENQLIVVGYDRAVHSVNLKTQEKQTILKRFGIGYDTIGLQCNNDRIIFYNSYQLEVVKFKKEIGKPDYMVDWIEEDSDNSIESFAWNPLKNIFFVCYGNKKKGIRQRNYATGISKDIVMDDQIYQIMTMHPKQEVMCMADYSGNISLRNIDDTLSKIKTIPLSSKLGVFEFCQYSADGSCIAVGNAEKIIMIDQTEDIEKCPLIKIEKGESIRNMTFHPNESILAILCNRTTETCSRRSACNKQLVRYWNIKTWQFIGETPELNCQTSYNVCFSDDGFELVVALEDKCVRMHVLFAIKDKCIYSLWALKQFQKLSLPQDVVLHITNILFEQFRF